jgi:hypothetical protein
MHLHIVGHNALYNITSEIEYSRNTVVCLLFIGLQEHLDERYLVIRQREVLWTILSKAILFVQVSQNLGVLCLVVRELYRC